METVEPVTLRANAPDGPGQQGVFRKRVVQPLGGIVIGARHKAEKGMVTRL